MSITGDIRLQVTMLSEAEESATEARNMSVSLEASNHPVRIYFGSLFREHTTCVTQFRFHNGHLNSESIYKSTSRVESCLGSP